MKSLRKLFNLKHILIYMHNYIIVIVRSWHHLTCVYKLTEHSCFNRIVTYVSHLVSYTNINHVLHVKLLVYCLYSYRRVDSDQSSLYKPYFTIIIPI